MKNKNKSIAIMQKIQRADLVANAQNKLLVLEKIINSIFNIKQTLIYCTSNPSPLHH